MEEFMNKFPWDYYYNTYISLFRAERLVEPEKKDMSPSQVLDELTKQKLHRTADYYGKLRDSNQVIADGCFPKQESKWTTKYFTSIEVKNNKCTLRRTSLKQWINPYGTVITGLFTVLSILLAIRLRLNQQKTLTIAACTIFAKLSIDIYLKPKLIVS